MHPCSFCPASMPVKPLPGAPAPKAKVVSHRQSSYQVNSYNEYSRMKGYLEKPAFDASAGSA
jgi:hypothetical protein